MYHSKHRSFRLTPEPYMVGMRVKPRLLCVYLAILMLRFSLVVGGIALFCAIVMRVPDIQPKAAQPLGIVGAVGHLFIGWLMSYAGFFLGLSLATRPRLLSDSEACAFRYSTDRWPECWIEPRPGNLQLHPLDAAGDEPLPAPDHSAYQILQSRRQNDDELRGS